MKTYFCYIHTTRSLTPELRTIGARNDEEAPEAIQAALAGWVSSLDLVEAIEVYSSDNEPMFKIFAKDETRLH